jgi:hypothetical protein
LKQYESEARGTRQKIDSNAIDAIASNSDQKGGRRQKCKSHLTGTAYPAINVIPQVKQEKDAKAEKALLKVAAAGCNIDHGIHLVY